MWPYAVIERREDDRRAELALVDQVLRLLVEAVDAEREVVVEQLLLHAEIVVVGALGDGRGVLGDGAGRHALVPANCVNVLLATSSNGGGVK